MIYKIDPNDPQEKINQEFLEACTKGNLEKVSHLLTSQEIPLKADIHYQDDDGFTRACEYGHIHIVKYLLTSPELKEHIDIASYNYLGFVVACENNNLELVKYLMSGVTLSKKVDVEAYSGFAFMEIGKRGHLDLVKYIFSESPARHYIQEESWGICFSNACKYKSYNVVRYFIFDLHYPEEKILKCLNKCYDQEIESMLEKRKLYQYLNLTLNDTDDEEKGGAVKI